MPRNRRRLGLVAGAAAAVAVIFAVPANARTSAVNACGLLSASQLRSIHVSTSCTHGTTPVTHQGTRYGTINWGHWGKVRHGYALANLLVINPAYVGIAKQKFLNGGTSAGIGDWSRWKGFANGKDEAEIVFGKGNRIVDLVLDPGSKHPLKSKQQVIAIARSALSHL
jgi:hypothetical protein